MSRLVAYLAARPAPQWRTNAADSLDIFRLLAVGAVATNHGALWAIGVWIGGRIVLALIDAVLAPGA